MKYFVLLALLPSILVAEIQNSICGDGTQCPKGKHCCESGCCVSSKELQDEIYVPGFPPASTFNETTSKAEPKTMKTVCNGTQCGDHCIKSTKAGICCSNQRYACPQYTKCCSNFDIEQPWCCKSSQRCGLVFYQCINSATTISTAMMSMFFAFMIGVFQKHLL